MSEIALRYNLNENGNNIKGSQQKKCIRSASEWGRRVGGRVGGWMDEK